MREPAMRDEQAGFTLVELMIALVIFSVAVAGILSVAVSLTNGFREQRQAIAAQDAVRSPLDMIADALRQVSPGVSDPSKVYDTSTCTQGAVTVINSSTGPDTLDIIYAAGGVVTTATAASTQAGTTLPVVSGANFAVGDYAMITNFSEGYVVQLTAVTATSITYGTNGCGYTWSFSYSSTDQQPVVIRVQHARFTVANDTTNNNMPTLFMDADSTGTVHSNEPLAEGIEDMQVAVGVDTDSLNGIVEGSPASASDEWYGNHASDVAFSGTTQIARAVRVTLIARTTNAQMGNLNTYTKPAAEDRTAASANDQYRRRVLRTVVDIRNASGSP